MNNLLFQIRFPEINVNYFEPMKKGLRLHLPAHWAIGVTACNNMITVQHCLQATLATSKYILGSSVILHEIFLFCWIVIVSVKLTDIS